MSRVFKDAPGCLAAAYIPGILELSDFVHCLRLVGLVWVVWMIVPFLGAIQFKYRLIRSLRDIFEDILDIVDAVTYFNIVMEIELTQQE